MSSDFEEFPELGNEIERVLGGITQSDVLEIDAELL